MTKKKRRDAYLRAAKLIFYDRFTYGCVALRNAAYLSPNKYGYNNGLYEMTVDHFPEMLLHNPDGQTVCSWLEELPDCEAKDVRLIILCMCAAMCE